MSFVDAAALPVEAATAFDAVRQLALDPASTLLINGIGGGVRVAAAQIARDSGLSVIGTGGDGKLDLVDPHAVDVRPLDEAGEALHAVESGHARGKVVIRVT